MLFALNLIAIILGYTTLAGLILVLFIYIYNRVGDFIRNSRLQNLDNQTDRTLLKLRNEIDRELAKRGE